MDEIKKPVKKKITLDNMTWKGYLTMATVGASLGMLIGKFL
jgi:hypothetical protein